MINMENKYFLEMNNIEKEYYGNKVLKDVTIRAKEGEVVALIGENGAGKSTIMNILFGMPVVKSTGGFKGQLVIDGKQVNINSPMDAMNNGIGMVHQEFMLINGYDVAENIKLNRENVKKTALSKIFGSRLNLLDKKSMYSESKQTLESFDLKLDVTWNAGNLSIGYKQFIEIARELDKKNVKLIVLDEPTAVLSEKEAEQFMDCVRAVAKKGIAFIFISHKLKEVKDISDHIYILRDGELVGDYPTKDTSVIEMSRLMVGREVEITNRSDIGEKREDTEYCVEVEHLKVDMVGEISKDISLKVKKGEIFGIGGLAGQGKTCIANGIMGQYPATGTVKLYGEEINCSDTKSTLQKKVAFLSEDRRNVGLALDESIELNMAIGAMSIKNDFTKSFLGIKFYDQKAGAAHADKMIKELDIRCTGRNQVVKSLSGGNQQKVCIARALTQDPDILFVSEPTRGIDIGAKKAILDALLKLNQEKGVTVIITSSELAELRSICNRIAIISEGTVAGVISPEEEDYKFGLLLGGMEIDENTKEEQL